MTPIYLTARAILAAALLIGAVMIVRKTLTIPAELPELVLASLVIAVVWTFLRSAVKPVIQFLLIPLTMLVVVLVLGAVTTFDLQRISGDVRPQTIPNWTGTILHGRNYSLYVGRQTGLEFRDAIIVRRGEQPRMRRHPELFWNAEDELLIIPGETPLSTEEVAGLHRLSVPVVLSTLADDLRRVMGILTDPLRTVHTIVTLVSFAFALVMSWTPARLTRWPLANGTIITGYAFFLLSVPRLTDPGFPRPVLFDRIPEPWWNALEGYHAALGWFLPGLILLVIAFLLPPFRRWQREMLPLGERS